ncbi:MAG TPA: HEAT repeat domain-containing protein, partial [Tepidisphaeraceae bacterium]|nr:HEAT repeat domain-containing protein [Tepidisphaeraceae bacterium]
MMYNTTRLPVRRAARFIALAVAALCLGSCTTDPPKKIANRYVTLPHKQVPEYLKDTILEYTDLGGTEPFPISGYGLVANLKGTGGSRAPAAVREFIIKDMARHGFGNVGGGLDSPEDILNNKSFAIVRVDGFLPVGARASHKDPASGEADWCTWFDVRVSALPESETASLAHGDLYATDLKVAGANPLDPGSGNVAVRAQAMGSIFINPAYALDDTTDTAAARSSRRTGVVIGGAKPLENRPLFLRLRSPERRMARAIERRVNEQFQDVMDKDLPVKGNTTFLCEAEDEGIVKVFVPRAYVDDWTHFAGVLKHLYLNGGLPQYATVKAEQLAQEAVKPGAALMDISYALEGLGKPAMHAITPLLTNPSPEVQFAAARAAAFIGDPAAVPVLMSIARTQGNPFRVNAVRALGQLPQSPMVDRLLTQLLGIDEAMVRIEAYEVLARHKDGAIYSRVIKRGNNEKFMLDIVPGGGTPMVYASRQGIPRLAVFGVRTAVDLPVMFVAMNNRLTISSVGDNEVVTVYYRGAELRKPVSVACGTSIAEIVAKLGGETVPGEQALDFSYADVV